MNPYTNPENYTLKNAKALISSVRNYYSAEPHVEEQVAYRMQKCLDANAKCIRATYGIGDDGELVRKLAFSSCEHCGCHAPALFYATNKTCRNKDGSIRWTNMLEKDDWEEYKRNNLEEEPNNISDNDGLDTVPGHTNSQSESLSIIEIKEDYGGQTNGGVSVGEQDAILYSTNLSS